MACTIFFSSHDKWCFGVGVRHIFSHSLDLESPGRPSYHLIFFIFRYFRLGYQVLLVYSAYFGWHKHILNLHTSIYTRYITLGKVFDIITRSRSSRQPSDYLLCLLDFSLLSTFEIFERALITPEIPHYRLKKKMKEGRAWLSPCLNQHTSHSTPYYIISFVNIVFPFFSFIPSRRGRRREEE